MFRISKGLQAGWLGVILISACAVATRHTSAAPLTVPSSTALHAGSSDGAGEIEGMVIGSNGLPVLGAQVTLSDAGQDVTTDTITNVDGSFKIDHLPSGTYSLRASSAIGEDSGFLLVGIHSPEAVRTELLLQEHTKSQPPVTTPNAPSAQKRGFFTRWGYAYIDDWTAASSGQPAAPAPQRRGWPAPLNSPPFPSADWPIGGTVVIGARDYQTYPLMQAINENKTRFKMYGWIDIGANASTSNKGRYANGETAYDVIPNSIQLDQAVLYLERLPNTVQQDHIDWGFRLANLYGLDYRYTTAKGVFSQQLLSGSIGQTYGYDPVMYYFDLYLPHLGGMGSDLRIGRYISLPDIEAQLAPNNYTYSHSILYTYDCYTQHGINLTTKFSNHWTAQGGVSGGCEIAPWVTGAKLTGNFCLDYQWHTGGDNLYFCANSLNSGKYGYNNLDAYYLTWYHKINPTWHTDTEGWYQFQRDVPNENYSGPGGYNAITDPSPIHGANGAYCSSDLATHCYAPEWAIVNYVEHEFNNHHESLNIRNEFFDDIVGQRTGTKTKYSEHLVGLDMWVGTTITIRPELRLEHSYDGPAYDAPTGGSPTKTTQFTAAIDMIYHY